MDLPLHGFGASAIKAVVNIYVWEFAPSSSCQIANWTDLIWQFFFWMVRSQDCTNSANRRPFLLAILLCGNWNRWVEGDFFSWAEIDGTTCESWFLIWPFTWKLPIYDYIQSKLRRWCIISILYLMISHALRCFGLQSPNASEFKTPCHSGIWWDSTQKTPFFHAMCLMFRLKNPCCCRSFQCFRAWTSWERRASGDGGVTLSRCCFVVKAGGQHDVTVYFPRYQLQLCESNCIDGNERPFLFWGHPLLKCPCK